MTRPTAVVMNMFYTGLGIARSLGERGIPVMGLTAQRGVYGNFTRYARKVSCPDSRNEPEALLQFLREWGASLGHRAVIFPTRDDDVVFLDRFRKELESHFILTIPEHSVVDACLDKWTTYLMARKAGVPTPKSWLVATPADLNAIYDELVYPCVLKPVAAHHWRRGANWQLVGGRKAFAVRSKDELDLEYATIARADQRVLIQEMVAGSDDNLVITGCYMNRRSEWITGFNTQKLLQVPEEFGTGCIVQSADRPELFEPTRRILEEMHFTGIAEVEFKWDAAEAVFKLIEINPRPWDQVRLGKACGADLPYLAYCDHAGLPVHAAAAKPVPQKWIAEDAFTMTALRMIWTRDARLRSMFRLAKGQRIYAIWSAKDPLPSIGYLLTRFIPSLMRDGLRFMRSAFRKKVPSQMYCKEGL